MISCTVIIVYMGSWEIGYWWYTCEQPGCGESPSSFFLIFVFAICTKEKKREINMIVFLRNSFLDGRNFCTNKNYFHKQNDRQQWAGYQFIITLFCAIFVFGAWQPGSKWLVVLKGYIFVFHSNSQQGRNRKKGSWRELMNCGIYICIKVQAGRERGKRIFFCIVNNMGLWCLMCCDGWMDYVFFACWRWGS